MIRRIVAVAPYAFALTAVLVASGLIALLSADARVANVSILYLPAVLVAAVRWGRGPAIAASLGAFLLYDVLFVEPRFHLSVADPQEWIALLLLLLAAVVTGQLAADQRARAREAQRREREAIVLYDVARLMGGPDLDRSLRDVAERVRRELGLAGVAIELSEAPGRRITVGSEVAQRTLIGIDASRAVAPGRSPTASERGGPVRGVRVVPPYVRRSPAPGASSVPIVAQGERAGTLLALGPEDARPSREDDRILAAVAAQLGSAIERERLRREAAETEVLRRTDELKSALLGAVSHDLRSPLASIIASVTSLRQQDVDWSDAERAELLAAIEEQSRRLDRLVASLLDLSRIEAGVLTPEKSWYDAGALVDDVLGRLRSLTAGRRVTVRVADDLPPVHLDYVEIDQALSNLVENATRHAPDGSEIEVDVSADGDSVRFEVRDHGPGVPAGAEGELFSPFPSVGQRGRRAPGVGLGLAIARRLVEAHGGRIWHERPADGGARFVFALPLGAAS